ncbi:MAG: hypothetical protein N2234_01860 [Planctomycetota bacterium]|nr:hypothetical protein [Planctomycetota bacterium]
MITLRIEGKSADDAAKELFSRILVSGEESLLVRLKGEGAAFAPALVTDKGIGNRNLVLVPPLLMDNAAVALSRLLRKETPKTLKKRLVAFLRPCEARAFVELTKLKQGSLEPVTLVTFLCDGALSLEQFRKGERPTFLYSGGLLSERNACRICLFPVAPFTDVQILLERTSLVLFAQSVKGESLLKRLGGGEEDANFEEKKRRVTEGKRKAREEFLSQMRERLKGVKNLRSYLADCVNCHNCMRLCPVCYCRLCFFESADMEEPLDHHIALAERDGLRSIEDEKLLFHLGRLEHMASLCVGCGVCDDACPNKVGIFGLFALVSDAVQKLFGYTPGADSSQPLPMTLYREEEFTHLG